MIETSLKEGKQDAKNGGIGKLDNENFSMSSMIEIQKDHGLDQSHVGVVGC